MFFDTHCHLNFQAFDNNLEGVIDRAKKAEVNQIVVPGTDIKTSKKAIEIAKKFPNIYAAVGIHPHHVYEIIQKSKIKSQNDNSKVKDLIKQIEELLINKKVVAIGEVGIDRHIYQKTVYKVYKVEERFIKLQKEFLKEQIKLAIKYDKSLILHNREAKQDMLEVLNKIWDKKLENRTVFHCCEPDNELLQFAIDHKMFIGVDGDITYKKDKQEFIKIVPLEMLVLETDSPFLSPDQKSINEPKNIKVIAEFIARLLHCSTDSLSKQTTENAKKLFKI